MMVMLYWIAHHRNDDDDDNNCVCNNSIGISSSLIISPSVQWIRDRWLHLFSSLFGRRISKLRTMSFFLCCYVAVAFKVRLLFHYNTRSVFLLIGLHLYTFFIQFISFPKMCHTAKCTRFEHKINVRTGKKHPFQDSSSRSETGNVENSISSIYWLGCVYAWWSN